VPAGEVLAAAFGRCFPGRAFHRRPEGPVASQPPFVGQAHQLVDPGLSRRGLPPPGLDAATIDRRGDPRRLAASGYSLEASQASDHQPRPGIRAKKKPGTA
jgi:hypothetical protein